MRSSADVVFDLRAECGPALLSEAADHIVFLQSSLTAARRALRTIAISSDNPEHIACEALDELMSIKDKHNAT